MIPVFTVLSVLMLSLLIVRFATVGLTLTGISRDLAKFQALSAFTGAGFTTKESEEVVSHPVRRRIVMHLMLLGHGGIVLAVTSVMLSFLSTANAPAPSGEIEQSLTSRFGVRLLVLGVGVFALWMLANSAIFERVIWRLNSWVLTRFGKLELRDYTRLLRLAKNYVVWELHVKPESWLVGRTLAQLQLNREGVLVLGIERATGLYLGAPRSTTRVDPEDCLILYGRQEALADLETRRADLEGNMHHVMAVTRHLDVLEEEGGKPAEGTDGM